MSLGAHVIFGDVNDQAADLLVQEMRGISSAEIAFRHVDVTSYADNVSLFEAGVSLHGHIDHAISVAGIGEQENIFSPDLDLDAVKRPPRTAVLDVNLLSALYFCRLAAAYLRHNNESSTLERSITLFSSISGFNDSPGMGTYAAAKHGVMGLMRAGRSSLPVTHGVRINAVAPWFTATEMTKPIRDEWLAGSLPVNQPEDVAHLVAGLMASPSANGKAVFVGGGQGWDIEAGLTSLRPRWLGAEHDLAIRATRAHMGTGTSWTKERK